MIPNYTNGTPISDEGLVTAMPVDSVDVAPLSTALGTMVKPEDKIHFHKTRTFKIFAVLIPSPPPRRANSFCFCARGPLSKRSCIKILHGILDFKAQDKKNRRRVICCVVVVRKKIHRIRAYVNPSLGANVPIQNFSYSANGGPSPRQTWRGCWRRWARIRSFA